MCAVWLLRVALAAFEDSLFDLLSMRVYRHTNIQLCKYTGIQVYRYTGEGPHSFFIYFFALETPHLDSPSWRPQDFKIDPPPTVIAILLVGGCVLYLADLLAGCCTWLAGLAGWLMLAGWRAIVLYLTSWLADSLLRCT